METLATYIINRREELGMSSVGLAKKSGLKQEMLEDIEAGKELFLPVTIRQKLAKALKCQPADLQQYEKVYNDRIVAQEVIDSIKNDILHGEEEILCPMCGSPLVTRIAEMYDLEDRLCLHAKAHCSKCVFQVKD